jgi:signal transduction histidine kinase
MDKNKEQDLLNTYHLWIDSFLEDATLIDQLDDLVSPDIMGYGTTAEERVFSIYKLKELCLLGHEQKQFLEDYSHTLNIVKKQYSSNDESAVIVAEITVSYTYNALKVVLQLRITTVLFYEKDKWKIVHWHGSTPVETEEGDTWHADEWKKENERLQQKVDEQTAELKRTIEHLKATQAQLIQSEKMASLGELTAGIAHEIQNPLNFVNNFSEVSNELIDEMNEEFENGNIEEAKAISEDIKQNLEKINHHGKRADAIVKGMLQHSRSSNGKRESTDINALFDEYLRLAYHGLRAKDKSFNATLITDFDKAIEKVSIVPQDIGRVILNLITNAFYVVDEKKKSGTENYEPTVTVSSKKRDSIIELKVMDNGNGIPETILNRIFEPFFTTKPTGKGTGLGLSMSYDIITKGHGGELEVKTEKGKGTEFIIKLPI